MTGKIFINYRRGDDPGNTGRLFDRLQEAFRPDQLFMDVDSIKPGLDFVKVLEEQVSQCDVVLAVIGQNWVRARDEADERRLDNPEDFVRIEIVSALAQGKRVIPVLVGEARMPRSDELPESLKPFARRHAVRLTHERFRADVQGLVKALEEALEEADALRQAQAEAARQTAADVEQEAAARQRAEEEAQRRREVEAERKAEAERRRGEEQRLREETQAKRRAEEEERRLSQPPPSGAAQQKFRPALLIGSLVGVVLLGAIGAWFALSPTPAPVTPTPPAPVTPALPPIAPTQQAANAPLSPTQEQALKPKDTFQECSKCPAMMVVPAGKFTMGSPASEPGRHPNEGPQHEVTIATQFAVGQYELTFDEWDACVAEGGCNGYKPDDNGWGRGRRPAINVSWDDANAYVAWLAKKTGKSYRLLTEAEYEYAARAGTTAAYPWGNAIGTDNANCNGCGSQWDNKHTAPVGSFSPNQFGLYDMAGNVWEWTEDCYHDSYNRAPADGSAWISADCSRRVVRGGSWDLYPQFLRSASRIRDTTGNRYNVLGFRVGRTLLTP